MHLTASSFFGSVQLFFCFNEMGLLIFALLALLENPEFNRANPFTIVCLE